MYLCIKLKDINYYWLGLQCLHFSLLKSSVGFKLSSQLDSNHFTVTLSNNGRVDIKVHNAGYSTPSQQIYDQQKTVVTRQAHVQYPKQKNKTSLVLVTQLILAGQRVSAECVFSCLLSKQLRFVVYCWPCVRSLNRWTCALVSKSFTPGPSEAQFQCRTRKWLETKF